MVGDALGGDGNYSVISTGAQLSRLHRRLSDVETFTFDTETSGLNPRKSRIVGYSVSPAAGEAYFVSVKTDGSQHLLRFVAQAGSVMHNAKFDWQMVKQQFGYDLGIADDTMIMAHLTDAMRPSQKLRDLVGQDLGRKATAYEDIIAGISGAQLSLREIALHGCEDADNTFRLWQVYRGPIARDYRRVHRIELSAVKPIAKMELRGVLLDGAMLEQLQQECIAKAKTLEEELRSNFGDVNLNSPDQISLIMKNRFSVPLKSRTKAGKLSMNKQHVLEPLRKDHNIVDEYLRWKELTRDIDVVICGLAEHVDEATQRVHSSFFQTAVFTGRMNSTNPNMQNIPKDKDKNLRRAFVAAPGKVLVALDYEQLELRIILLMSKSPALARIVSGDDIHKELASIIYDKGATAISFKEREESKRIAYGIVYDITVQGLAHNLRCSEIKAAAIMQAFHRGVPGVREFVEERRQFAVDNGYAVSMFGRRRSLPEIKSLDQKERMYGLRSAVNHTIAGTASDIFKLALSRTDRTTELMGDEFAGGILPVHDEIIVEMTATGGLVDHCRHLAEAMSIRIGPMPFPVGVEVGTDWGSMKPLEEWSSNDISQAVRRKGPVQKVRPEVLRAARSLARDGQLFLDDCG